MKNRTEELRETINKIVDEIDLDKFIKGIEADDLFNKGNEPYEFVATFDAGTLTKYRY